MGTKINQSETTLLYNGIPLNFKVEKIYIVITYNNGHVLMCMHRTAARSDGIGSKSFHGLLVPSEVHVYFLHAPNETKIKKIQKKRNEDKKTVGPGLNSKMNSVGISRMYHTDQRSSHMLTV